MNQEDFISSRTFDIAKKIKELIKIFPIGKVFLASDLITLLNVEKEDILILSDAFVMIASLRDDITRVYIVEDNGHQRVYEKLEDAGSEPLDAKCFPAYRKN